MRKIRAVLRLYFVIATRPYATSPMGAGRRLLANQFTHSRVTAWPLTCIPIPEAIKPPTVAGTTTRVVSTCPASTSAAFVGAPPAPRSECQPITFSVTSTAHHEDRLRLAEEVIQGQSHLDRGAVGIADELRAAERLAQRTGQQP